MIELKASYDRQTNLWACVCDSGSEDPADSGEGGDHEDRRDDRVSSSHKINSTAAAT